MGAEVIRKKLEECPGISRIPQRNSKRHAGGIAGEMGDLQLNNPGFYSPLIFAKLPVICEVDFQSSLASS
jgi:hypothetical protein